MPQRTEAARHRDRVVDARRSPPVPAPQFWRAHPARASRREPTSHSSPAPADRLPPPGRGRTPDCEASRACAPAGCRGGRRAPWQPVGRREARRAARPRRLTHIAAPDKAFREGLAGLRAITETARDITRESMTGTEAPVPAMAPPWPWRFTNGCVARRWGWVGGGGDRRPIHSGRPGMMGWGLRGQRPPTRRC